MYGYQIEAERYTDIVPVSKGAFGSGSGAIQGMGGHGCWHPQDHPRYVGLYTLYYAPTPNMEIMWVCRGGPLAVVAATTAAAAPGAAAAAVTTAAAIAAAAAA